MVIGLALLLHLQLGLTRIANFGVVGFWGLGMYAFGVLYVQVDWPFGDPWQFLVCAAGRDRSSPGSPACSSAGSSPTSTRTGSSWDARLRHDRPHPGHHRAGRHGRRTRPRRARLPVRPRHRQGRRARLAAGPGRGRRRSSSCTRARSTARRTDACSSPRAATRRWLAASASRPTAPSSCSSASPRRSWASSVPCTGHGRASSRSAEPRRRR